jgi:hypothetical protein
MMVIRSAALRSLSASRSRAGEFIPGGVYRPCGGRHALCLNERIWHAPGNGLWRSIAAVSGVTAVSSLQSEARNFHRVVDRQVGKSEENVCSISRKLAGSSGLRGNLG